MKDKVRILFILPGFNYGGTVFSTYNMISLLDKSKYDIYVLAMSHQGGVKQLYKSFNLIGENLILAALMGRIAKESAIIKKFVFFIIKLFNRILLLFNIHLFDYLKRTYCEKLYKMHRFDIVASCQEGPATYLASCFFQTKRIAWFRSEYKFYMERITPNIYAKEQFIYEKMDCIVCVSNTTREDFIEYFPLLKNRIMAIHNVQDIDTILLKSKDEIDDVKFDNSLFTIVSIGRIDPQKRFSLIPELAAKLKYVGKFNFRWYIIGEGNVFGEYDKIQANIEKYDVSDSVICLGSKINPYPYIVSSDLLVNTSYVEACPRVVIESKILKTPVICADFSSAREFVTDGYDGYVDKVENLNIPIADMISNKFIYDKVKANCNKFVMDNQRVLEQLAVIFKKL